MAEQHPRPLSPAQSRPSQPGHCQASGVRVEDIFTWPSKCYTLLNRFHCPAQDRRWTKSSPPHSHHVAEFHRDRILLLSRREESSRRRDKFEELRLHVQPNPHGPRPFRMPRQRYMVVTTWIHYAAATGRWRAHSCLLSSQPGTSRMSGERGWRTGGGPEVALFLSRIVQSPYLFMGDRSFLVNSFLVRPLSLAPNWSLVSHVVARKKKTLMAQNLALSAASVVTGGNHG